MPQDKCIYEDFKSHSQTNDNEGEKKSQSSYISYETALQKKRKGKEAQRSKIDKKKKNNFSGTIYRRQVKQKIELFGNNSAYVWRKKV